MSRLRLKPAKLGLDLTFGTAIGIIAVVSLLSSGAILATLAEVDRATAQHARSTRVLAELDRFRSAMLNQETGLRGYLLSGDAANLEPYRAARPELDGAIATLKDLLGPHRGQLRRLTDAEKAARSWQAEIGEPAVNEMSDPTTRGKALVREMSGDAKRLFDAFRGKLDSIRDEEDAALEEQNAVVSRAERNATLALTLGTVVTLAICGGVALALNRLIVRPLVSLAEVMRRLARRDLSAHVPAVRGRSEVGDMARAVDVFRQNLVELDRTSLLRMTTDTLPAMVGYIDARRRVGFLNGEFGAWFDLDAADVAELYGKPLDDVFSAVTFPGRHRELEAAFTGEETRFEHRLPRQDGAQRDLDAVFRPHRTTDGAVIGVVTLLTDITGRKAMERRLARQAADLLRSNDELEQFAYVASHDLKAPLRGIENLVTWIEEDLDAVLEGDTRANMNLLKSRVRRLDTLLDDLLAYSRAGRADVSDELVDTRALIEDLAALVGPPPGFEIAADPSLPVLRAPRAPITQVFQNLIGNAIKHHDRPAAGHVRIAADRLDGMAEFRVSDDGPGIPERYRERVFGMFQTLRPRDEVEGSGMGLAVVKKIVERRGGRIWLTDAAGERGLAVRFTWPDARQGEPDGADR